jgi:hypothetical protein
MLVVGNLVMQASTSFLIKKLLMTSFFFIIQHTPYLVLIMIAIECFCIELIVSALLHVSVPKYCTHCWLLNYCFVSSDSSVLKYCWEAWTCLIYPLILLNLCNISLDLSDQGICIFHFPCLKISFPENFLGDLLYIYLVNYACTFCSSYTFQIHIKLWTCVA